MNEELDWGALRSHCAERAWHEAWSEAGGCDDGEVQLAERYILDMASACNQTPEAVRAWRRAFGRVGYQRIQRLAGWTDLEDRMDQWTEDTIKARAEGIMSEALAGMLGMSVSSPGNTARALAEAAYKTAQIGLEMHALTKMAARTYNAINPAPRGPQPRKKRRR